jgi:hypothetical protein
MKAKGELLSLVIVYCFKTKAITQYLAYFQAHSLTFTGLVVVRFLVFNMS